MSTPIPSAVDIRASLAALSLDQLDRLAELSGVPLPTLSKIRYGQTLNPGIETVRRFVPHIAELINTPGAPAVPEAAKA
jgi:hypothetical protein